MRWQFKIDNQQVLEVIVKPSGSFANVERFYARIGQDGRVAIPKMTLKLMEGRKESLVGSVLEIELRPAETLR